MSFKFVSLYGVVVILTSLFFQFVPLPKMLSWEELLLSKLLNQAPALLCMGYLWVQRERIKKAGIFYLLMAFLFFNVFSEIYYYFVSDNYLLISSIFNNILMYLVLIVLYLKQRVQIPEEVAIPKNIFYAVSTGLLFLVGFSFSLIQTYEEYFVANKLFFFIVLLGMLTTTITVCISFFVDKPFSKNWYKIVFGTIGVGVLDVYVYMSIFVLGGYSTFTYTVGKLIFSVGILLIADRTMRKCLSKAPLKITYKKVSKTT
ncbi:hypothetical protein [Emticicia sp. C21]|uniref:hypothetical protein n=1 Tax=Emticicia sp. C21 TaxID=2302915 RepID=UPI000E34B175|nr:hypothetical protein [Emticicia sp. C21]RFS17421.1 hypothetical protein D0T08_06475 [Emticicia sp. C21]